jgi:hypothetical protein
VLAAFDHLGDGFGGVAGYVDACLCHGFDDDGIEHAGLDAGALGVEFGAAVAVD